MMRFERKVSALALSLMVSAFASGAHAQSVDLQVTGSIKPAACAPLLSGGGVVDFGVIQAGSLNMTAPTVLPTKTTVLTITCDAPAQIGFKLLDNRSAFKADVGYDYGVGFGLGLAGEVGMPGSAFIGAYKLSVKPDQFTVDGAQGYGLYSTDYSLATWGNISAPKDLLDYYGGYYDETYSVAKSSGASAPEAFQTMTATIEVEARLSEGEWLPLGDRIELDGSATIELHYL